MFVTSKEGLEKAVGESAVEAVYQSLSPEENTRCRREALKVLSYEELLDTACLQHTVLDALSSYLRTVDRTLVVRLIVRLQSIGTLTQELTEKTVRANELVAQEENRLRLLCLKCKEMPKEKEEETNGNC